MPIPASVNEPVRLAALDAYKILDTAPEAGFDDIAHLASVLCQTPIALVSLVAETRQWFKARVGLEACETDINRSVCAHVLDEPDILVIPDLTADERTKNNPLVVGELNIRFYAGAPLRTPDGQVLGALCTIDTVARPQGLSTEQADNLKRLARQVMTQLELRKTSAAHAARNRQITETRAALRESEERYRTLFETMDEGFCIIEFIDGPHGPLSDYVHVEANRAYAHHAGITNVVGQKVREMVPGEADGWVELYSGVLRTGTPIRFERELVATGRHLELAAFRIEPESRRQVAVLFQDITARKRAEADLQRLNETLEQRVAAEVAERTKAEEALRQSQKMEAVGQLTGGIAHDFNNLLTGISGSLELLQTKISQGRLTEADRYITAAQGASRRAASLTHRLLAFSRRQTLDPKPTDANRLVTGMEDLIRRTVGPAVALEVVSAGGLWTVLIDPPQLENALLNLCINARDAMPDGGRITIETANKWLDTHAAQTRDLPPGQYVSICVTDTGTGMTPDVIEKAFDPFFTTKPLGQGTGLGLSMIYGFVRQSGGQVRVYSELGRGTTMCLYLPRHYGDEEHATSQLEPTQMSRAEAGETVLIVDDEPTVRMLVTEVLEELGYTAVEAADGPSGLKVLQSDLRIDLLVTDVGLPGGMNGRQLADAARLTRPDLKILFITGYAENAVIGNGHLEPGMQVLTKPFAIEALASRIRDMIAP